MWLLPCDDTLLRLGSRHASQTNFVLFFSSLTFISLGKERERANGFAYSTLLMLYTFVLMSVLLRGLY